MFRFAFTTYRVFFVALVLACFTSAASAAPVPHVDAKLREADERVEIERKEDGTHRFVLQTASGRRELTPEEFASQVYEEQRKREWWLGFLNISTPVGIAWVTVGLLGQMLFTGRMLVQWVASEKSKTSVIPVAFWWLSLVGATMLLVYFVWRKDVIGVLGQATGWWIYLRNLYLIHRNTPAGVGEDPGPEPELDVRGR